MKRLKWNWKKLFKARGIDNPYKWLRKLGFSHNIAHRIASDTCDMLSCEHLQRLCIHLNCTPDDVLEFSATEEEVKQGRLALLKLSKNPTSDDAAKLLRGLSFRKLQELAKVMGNQEEKGKE